MTYIDLFVGTDLESVDTDSEFEINGEKYYYVASKKRIKNSNNQWAVLYSPDYGAGWSSWNEDYTCFCPPIVMILLTGNKDKFNQEEVENIVKKYYGIDYFYTGGYRDLTIKWIADGTAFKIDEYDGAESVKIINEIKFII